MSLRKSPTLTPALLAANRRNARKSTGPRTARGKAWSSLNRMKEGGRSCAFREFIHALDSAPAGGVEAVAEAYLDSRIAVHPLFRQIAEVFIQAEIETRAEFGALLSAWRECDQNTTFEAGMLLKTMVRGFGEGRRGRQS